jgi:putative sterol carrier protein
MAVRFLSQEWADQVKSALNADEAFRAASVNAAAKLLQVISTSEGETRYWITIDHGQIDMGIGDLEGADASIAESYDTAAALAKGELSPVTGFMTGKVKIQGNMGMLLGLQGALARLPAAMSTLDVDY